MEQSAYKCNKGQHLYALLLCPGLRFCRSFRLRPFCLGHQQKSSSLQLFYSCSPKTLPSVVWDKWMESFDSWRGIPSSSFPILGYVLLRHRVSACCIVAGISLLCLCHCFALDVSHASSFDKMALRRCLIHFRCFPNVCSIVSRLILHLVLACFTMRNGLNCRAIWA